MRADHDDAAPDLPDWPMHDLQYEIRYQTAKVVSTWGMGVCGHKARGCRICAACLQAEIDRRTAAKGGGEGG